MMGIPGWVDPFSGGGGGGAAVSAPAPAGLSGWVDPLSPGGGGLPQGPVQTAQAGIDKYLNTIQGSGDKNAIGQANKAAGGGGHHSWFSSVLSALDLPRAAVVSGIDQIANGGSLSNWLKGTTSHETTGHLLNDLGVHNKVFDSIAGVVGDVAFDPLTYLGGMGEIGRTASAVGHVAEGLAASEKAARLGETANMTGEALKAATAAGSADLGVRAAEHAAASQAASQAAEKAAELTHGGSITADTMATLKTKGIAGLTPVERASIEHVSRLGGGPGLDLTTGVGLRAPGSKLLGSPKYLKLVSGGVTDPISAGLKGLASRAADTKFLQGLQDKFVTDAYLKNAVRSAALDGDGQRAADLQNILRYKSEATGVARDALNFHGPAFADALSRIPDSQAHNVAGALEGDPGALAAIHAAGGNVGPLQDAYSAMRDEATQHGVPMGNIENYFPHQLTDAAREAMQKQSTVRRAKGSFEGALGRSYKAGDTFLGQTLDTGSVAEMNQIAHDVYGKNAFDLFRSDPREVTANYVRGLSRRMGEQHLANRLDELGVTASGDLAKSPEDWQSLLAQTSAQRLSKPLESAVGTPHTAGQDLVSLGSTGANAGRLAPQYVKDALTKMAELQSQPKTPNSLLRFYDKALSAWKAYELAMPGKAIRHTIASPAWGSYLGNVGTTNLRTGFKAWRAYMSGGIEAVKDPQLQHEIQSAVDQGVFHGHDFHTQDITGPTTRTGKLNKAIHNPLSTKQGYFKANAEIQRRGQDYWRFAMFHDAMQKGALAPEAARKTRMFLGDPHAITQFERGTARRVVPFYCVPTDHEALTRRGWRRHDELVVGEDMMVLDPITHEMRWEPLLEVATFDFDGELRRLTRNGHDFLFTDNHRWPVESNRTFTKGKWYGGDRKMVEAQDLNGNHRLPLVGQFVSDEESILSPRLAGILGWIVSDGHARWRGNHWEAVVYQSPSKFLADIVTLLETAPRKPHPQTGVVAVTVAHADREALKKHYHSKSDLPDLVCKLSRTAAEAMWQAMFDAEGCTSPKGQRHFAQVPGPVLEAFQILSLMTGRSAWISSRGAYVRKGGFINAVEKKMDGREQYVGTVWCPRTPTGTWVMRHGGAVIPTGNTFLRQNLPVELGAVAKQPGKFVNAYEAPKREVEQNSPQEGLVPQFFGDTLSARSPFHVGGSDMYISPDLPFTRIGSLFSGKNQLESQTSPLIQDAISVFNNANTFTGQPFSSTAKAAPGTWEKIPGLMELLHAIAPGSVMQTNQASTDFGQTTPKGQWMIQPKAESIIESLVPPLGQSRRLDATEQNMKPRQETTWLADLFGQNFRTNDPYQQAGELYRRQATLKAIIEGLQNKGELPKYIYGFHQ